MTHEHEYRQVFGYAVARLAKRDYATAELREKLIHYIRTHQYETLDDTHVEKMIERLQAERLLSDTRYAESIVRYCGNRLGPDEIIRRLRAKGVPENIIAGHREAMTRHALKAAHALWEKKFGLPPENDKMRRRQIDYLARRGFSFNLIYRLLDMLNCGDLSELESEAS